MLLETIAINWAGQLVVEPAAEVRTIATSGACEVTDLFTGQPLAGQGNDFTRRWFYETQPHNRASAVIVEAEGPVVVIVRQFYAEATPEDLRWDFANVAWGGPADFNVDGAVDTFDFLAFQNAFDAGDMACDFDGDGVLGFFDFLAFIGEF